MSRLLCLFLITALAACGGGGSVATPSTPAPTPAPTAGDLFVANVHSANIVRLDPAGGITLTLQGGIAPAGTAVAPNGNVVIAGNQQSVLFLHPQGATPFSSFSSPSILGAKGAALDAASNVYVGDVLASTVWRFGAQTTGANAMPAASVHWIESTYGTLIGFDVDAAGDIFVLSSKSYLLIYAAQASSYASVHAVPILSDAPAPNGVTVDSSGDIYVVNASRDLLRYTNSGAFISRETLPGLCTTSAVRNATILDTVTSVTHAYLYTANACGGTSGSQILSYRLPTPFPSTMPIPTAGPTATPFAISVMGPNSTQGITDASTIAVDQSGGPQTQTVYVSTPLSDIVSGYCNGCIGNSAPSAQFSLGYPGMDGIQALWFDNGLMYTGDSAASAITVYPAPAKSALGTVSPIPIARIIGSNAGLCGISYGLSDAQHNVLVALACKTANYVAKYVLPPGINGINNLTPVTFAGTPGTCPGTLLCNPQQMALDSIGNLYVTNYGINADVTSTGSVVKFSSTGATKAIMVSADIHNPSGLAIDAHGNVGVLSNLATNGTPEIAFFAPVPDQTSPSAPVHVTPLYTITSSALGGTPFPQMQIGSDGTIYVNEFTSIVEFAPGARGTNVMPSLVVHEPTRLTGGTGLALQP